MGRAFGPVMLLWFVTMGMLGIVGIAHHPGVLVALNPAYGFRTYFVERYDPVSRAGRSLPARAPG